MVRSNKVTARLLTKAEAASYCGVSVATFLMLCPVRPVALGAGKRLERYDLLSLDKWIDSLDQFQATRGRDWLKMMDAGHD